MTFFVEFLEREPLRTITFLRQKYLFEKKKKNQFYATPGMTTNVYLNTLWLKASPLKKSKKSGGKRISCHTEVVHTIGLCVSRFSSEKVCSTDRRKIGIKSRRHILQGHVAPHKDSWKKGSIARSYSKVRTSITQSVCANI